MMEYIITDFVQAVGSCAAGFDITETRTYHFEVYPDVVMHGWHWECTGCDRKRLLWQA